MKKCWSWLFKNVKVDFEVIGIETAHVGDVFEGSREDLVNLMAKNGYILDSKAGHDEFFVKGKLSKVVNKFYIIFFMINLNKFSRKYPQKSLSGWNPETLYLGRTTLASNTICEALIFHLFDSYSYWCWVLEIKNVL